MASPVLSSKRFDKSADLPELAVEQNQAAIKRALDHSDTAALARAIWESKGCPSSSDQEHWFEAEKKLKVNMHSDPGLADS
jgi:hypothetical protein